jgi:hypothetical protein
MRWRQSDVFVQVEELYSGPVNAGNGDESFQKLDLRSRACRYDASSAVLSDRAADRRSALLGGGDRERLSVWEYVQVHDSDPSFPLGLRVPPRDFVAFPRQREPFQNNATGSGQCKREEIIS